MGFIISPFLSPFMMGFIVARIKCVHTLRSKVVELTLLGSWRWTYGIGSIYGLFVVLMIAFFGEETCVSLVCIVRYLIHV